MLGFNFITGKTLYTVGRSRDLEDKYVYKKHPKYIMSVELKKKAITLDTFPREE